MKLSKFRWSNGVSRREQCVLESLERRQLMTAVPVVAPVNFTGEYVVFDNSQVLALNFRSTKLSTHFTSDLDIQGVDRRFNAIENSAGTLSGTIPAEGAFTATLSGTSLAIVLKKTGATTTLSQVSTTPGPLPSPLAAHVQSEIKYKSPGNWKVTVGEDGILMTSANGTEQVGVFATVASGEFTADQIAQSEEAAGGTLISSRYLANGAVSSTEYKQAGMGLLEYTVNGVPYVSGQIIETLIHTDTDQTVTLRFQVSAPQSQFAGVCPQLIDMLTSVQYNSTAKIALKTTKTTAQTKSNVPGAEGSWSTSPALAKDEEAYAAEIEEETLASESDIDSSVDSFCDFLTS